MIKGSVKIGQKWGIDVGKKGRVRKDLADQSRLKKGPLNNLLKVLTDTYIQPNKGAKN